MMWIECPRVTYVRVDGPKLQTKTNQCMPNHYTAGRLHQVEYAIEAINNAGTCVGILCKEGIVLAGACPLCLVDRPTIKIETAPPP